MANNIIHFQISNKKKGDKMCKILKQIQGHSPEDLLIKYGIQLKPPIQIETLLKKIGISVIAQDFTEVEIMSGFEKGSVLGAAISNGDDLGIFYRTIDNKNSRRFTMAHELAHCCLDCKLNEVSHLEFRTTENADYIEELKANEFAEKLLIPEKVLRDTYSKFIVPSLTDLAEIFEVPVNIMMSRLDYLDLAYYKDTNPKDC